MTGFFRSVMRESERTLAQTQTAVGVRCGFLAVSTGAIADDTRKQAYVRSLKSALVWAARDVGYPWRLEFIRGREAGSAASADIARWVRSEMVHRADFLVALVLDPSCGCGREVGIATEIGLPAHVVVPRGRDTSPLMSASAPSEGSLDPGAFSSNAELRENVRAFFGKNHRRIDRSDERRQRRVAEKEPQRSHCTTGWKRLTPAQRDEVAAELGISRGDLRDLLADPVDFAWASGDFHNRLTDAVWSRASTTQVSAWLQDRTALTPDEMVAFYAAVDEYRWVAETAARVLAAGCEYERKREAAEAVGVRLRMPRLTTRLAWKRVHDDLVREP